MAQQWNGEMSENKWKDPGFAPKPGQTFKMWLHLPPIVPPLEDEDEAGDEWGRSSEGDVKLGRQRRQKHCRHSDVFTDLQGAAQVVENEDNLDTSPSL